MGEVLVFELAADLELVELCLDEEVGVKPGGITAVGETMWWVRN